MSSLSDKQRLVVARVSYPKDYVRGVVLHLSASHLSLSIDFVRIGMHLMMTQSLVLIYWE